MAHKWVTLNNTAVRTEDILSVEMDARFSKIAFRVLLTSNREMTVELDSTGGKYLYYICEEGVKTSNKAKAKWEEDKQ
jgi:hypothetical protein